MVCMGNICRSPVAEAVTRSMLHEHGLSHRIAVDSAGTHGYHVGHAPDGRMQSAARRRGFELSDLRARQVEDADFERFDLILAMDRDNLAYLMERCPRTHRHRVRLFMGYASHRGREEVPDPYYGGAAGFETVLDLVEDAARGLVENLRKSVG
ncbi:MAG: low molecular weight phosphotyrosine protein phosphatase [Betaproteobacteria bacterium]|nr:low molecular weight phosphotyrosine protein phosphatase [Betaproteobacteria bacterium]